MKWKYQRGLYRDPLGSNKKKNKYNNPKELIQGTHSKVIGEERYGIDISSKIYMFSLKARLDGGIYECCIDKFSFFAKDINGCMIGLDPHSAKKYLEIFSEKVESALKAHPEGEQLLKIFLQLKKKCLRDIKEDMTKQ